MAITIRHDAAAVALPANSAQRKYGQSIVLQQQQQKYAAQQAANDRLSSALQQQQPARNNWQWGGNANQGRQQGGQQRGFGLTTTVDAQKQAMADAEQRKKDFEAARSRMDTYAKDMLANGEIEDQETKNKIRNLIAGKSIVMGSGFDETARQHYLDQYNSELAKIMSEVPPPKPKAPPQPNFHTDQNGNQWVESGPGKWEPVPQPAPAPPASPAEAFKSDPKIDDKYQKMAEARMMGADGEMPQVDSEEVGEDGKKKKRDMTPQEFQKAVKELKADLWNIDNVEESPTVAPDISSGEIPVVPQEASILEQSPPAGMPITPPDPGRPPAPPQQAPPPAAAGGKLPMPLTSNSSSQNPWSELAAADQQPQMTDQARNEFTDKLQRQGAGVVTMDNGQQAVPAPLGPPVPRPQAEVIPSANSTPTVGGLPQVAPPDFGKLLTAAGDDDDKAAISQIQGLVGQYADSPDIVNALHVLVSSGAGDKVAAFKYLQSAGVDLKQLIANEPSRAEKIRGVQEENKKRFGNSRDLMSGF